MTGLGDAILLFSLAAFCGLVLTPKPGMELLFYAGSVGFPITIGALKLVVAIRAAIDGEKAE